MGVLTRTQMNSEVATIIDRTDFTTQINTRLGWSYEDIAEAKQWKVLQAEDKTTTLVTSTQDYSIPSALRTVEYIWMVDETAGVKTMLRPEDLEEFIERRRHLSTTTGEPSIWTMVGNKVRLHLTPSTTENGNKLYMIGKKRISYFTSDSDTTELDQKLDRAIIYKTAQICFNDLLFEGSEAKRYAQLFEEAVDNAYTEELAFSQL